MPQAEQIQAQGRRTLLTVKPQAAGERRAAGNFAAHSRETAIMKALIINGRRVTACMAAGRIREITGILMKSPVHGNRPLAGHMARIHPMSSQEAMAQVHPMSSQETMAQVHLMGRGKLLRSRCRAVGTDSSTLIFTSDAIAVI